MCEHSVSLPFWPILSCRKRFHHLTRRGMFHLFSFLARAPYIPPLMPRSHTRKRQPRRPAVRWSVAAAASSEEGEGDSSGDTCMGCSGFLLHKGKKRWKVAATANERRSRREAFSSFLLLFFLAFLFCLPLSNPVIFFLIDDRSGSFLK